MKLLLTSAYLHIPAEGLIKPKIYIFLGWVLWTSIRRSRGRRVKGVYNKTPLKTIIKIHLAVILIANWEVIIKGEFQYYRA